MPFSATMVSNISSASETMEEDTLAIGFDFRLSFGSGYLRTVNDDMSFYNIPSGSTSTAHLTPAGRLRSTEEARREAPFCTSLMVAPFKRICHRKRPRIFSIGALAGPKIWRASGVEKAGTQGVTPEGG